MLQMFRLFKSSYFNYSRRYISVRNFCRKWLDNDNVISQKIYIRKLPYWQLFFNTSIKILIYSYTNAIAWRKACHHLKWTLSVTINTEYIMCMHATAIRRIRSWSFVQCKHYVDSNHFFGEYQWIWVSQGLNLL